MNTKNNTKESEAPKLRLTDRKRAGILAAAVAEFQRNGFEGTSMDRVAAAANASKRTVYNHFKSKDALFSAIIAEVHDRFGEIEDVPYDSEADLETQLVTIGQRTAETTMNEDFISLARVVISRFMQSPRVCGSNDEGAGHLPRWACKMDQSCKQGWPLEREECRARLHRVHRADQSFCLLATNDRQRFTAHQA